MSAGERRISRRRFLEVGGLSAAALALGSGKASGQPPEQGVYPAAPDQLAEDLVVNIGHRGVAGLAPEHTFASYDLAVDLGADYIEQDLQLTEDGVLVVLHDETLDRTARGPEGDCTGLVKDRTLEQIETCEVGSWFNEAYPRYARPEYVGLKIPTMEEVFRRYRHRVNYYIETKSPGMYPEMGDKLLALMDEYHLRRPAAERWQVLIQSFSPESLLSIHELDPSLPLVRLYSDTDTSETIRADLDSARTYAVGIGPAAENVDAELVAAAHERCLYIHPYTVDTEPAMRDLIGIGVDGMFTNFANRLDDVLGKRGSANGKQAARRAAYASRACRANG